MSSTDTYKKDASGNDAYKIAVISDVHSNIFALAELMKRIVPKVNRIYCCGDILGYYPYQEETVKLFIKHGIVSIRGNHDKYIAGLLVPRRSNSMLEKSIKYSRSRLSKKTKDFIRRLPDTLIFAHDGVDIAIFHGLFKDCEFSVSQARIGSYLQDKANKKELSDFNFFGHTHIPFIAKRRGRLFVNAGSVGYPRAGLPCYIIFDVHKRIARRHYFEYPVERLKRDILKSGLDGDYKKMLLRPLL